MHVDPTNVSTWKHQRGFHNRGVVFGLALSAPWQDSGIAQGRVLSPLLFNLVDTLASDGRRLAPGAHLSCYHGFLEQLYADDLVLVADCEHDLQVSCDVVPAWAREWCFTFGVVPTKSAVMVFGRGVPSLLGHLGRGSSPLGL